MQKFASVSLENLSSGLVRATGRVHGRSVASFEGNSSEARQLCEKAIAVAGLGLSVGGGKYDMNFIEVNEAAKIALAI